MDGNSGLLEVHDFTKCEDVIEYLNVAQEEIEKGISSLNNNHLKIAETTRCSFTDTEMNLVDITNKTPNDIINHYCFSMDKYLEELVKYENEDYYKSFGINIPSILSLKEKQRIANCLLNYDTLKSLSLFYNVGSIDNLLTQYKETLNIGELSTGEINALISLFAGDYQSTNINGIQGLVLQSNMFRSNGVDSYLVKGFGAGMKVNAANAASLQYIFNMLSMVSDGQFLNNGSLVTEGKPDYSLHRTGNAFDIFTSLGIRVNYDSETKDVSFSIEGKNCNKYASEHGMKDFTMYDVFYVVPELEDGSSPQINDLLTTDDYKYRNYVLLKPGVDIPPEMEKYVKTGPLENVLTVDDYTRSTPSTKDGNIHYTTITPSESLGENNNDLKFLDFTALCNDNGWRGIGPHEGWTGSDGKSYQDSEWHHIQAMNPNGTDIDNVLVIDNKGNIINPEILINNPVAVDNDMEAERGSEVETTAETNQPYIYTTAPEVKEGLRNYNNSVAAANQAAYDAEERSTNNTHVISTPTASPTPSPTSTPTASSTPTPTPIPTPVQKLEETSSIVDPKKTIGIATNPNDFKNETSEFKHEPVVELKKDNYSNQEDLKKTNDVETIVSDSKIDTTVQKPTVKIVEPIVNVNYESNDSHKSNINPVNIGINWPETDITRNIPVPKFGITGMQTSIENENFIFTIFGCDSNKYNDYLEILKKFFVQLNDNTYYRESDNTTITLLEKNNDDVEIHINR